MLLSRLGLVELTQPDITLSGLNPFELRQSRIEANQGGTDLKRHAIYVYIYTYRKIYIYVCV